MKFLDTVDELDLPGLIRHGDAVVCSQGLGEPVTLTTRLMQQRTAIGPIQLFVGPSFSTTFKPEHGDAVAFQSYCGIAGNAALHAAGVLDIVPAHYSDLAPLFREGVLRCDVALLSAREENGHFNLGLNNDYVIDAARRARVVIVEASDRIPWVHGADLPPEIRPDVVVRSTREPLTLPRKLADDGDDAGSRIADSVSTLIPDGATLELGVGTLPELVLQALRGHRDIGIHSGILCDGMVELVNAGVITNSCKPWDQGVSVAAGLMGTRKLFDFAHRNPAVRLAPSSQTHDVAVLRSLPNFVAINGAIEVDLTGQVNSEVLNDRYIGAVGGQLDFVRGANGSRGGRSIMLLPSTARHNTISRVVPLKTTGVVTTPRSDVDVVVTEWGVAELRGKSLTERVEAMTAIAHPDFREELERSGHALTRSRRATSVPPVGAKPATGTLAKT